MMKYVSLTTWVPAAIACKGVDSWSITIALKPEFAAERAQPGECRMRPSACDAARELSRQQDPDEQASHPFPSFNAHVFHIEAISLIEAIAMFNLAPPPRPGAPMEQTMACWVITAFSTPLVYPCLVYANRLNSAGGCIPLHREVSSAT